MPSPPGETRSAILRATLQLVGSGGVGKVSNRNVARAANVSLGSLTYHFDSQSALLREALEMFIVEETARLEVLARQLAEAELSVEQAAAALQGLLGQEPERRVAKLELYLQAARDEELRPAAVRCFEAYDRLATSAGKALGVDGAEYLAPIMVALIDGLQLRRLARGDAELHVAEPLMAVLRGLQNN